MYRPKTTYSQEDLTRLAIEDLQVDLRCAIRDGLTEYAQNLEDAIARIESGEPLNSVLGIPFR